MTNTYTIKYINYNIYYTNMYTAQRTLRRREDRLTGGNI